MLKVDSFLNHQIDVPFVSILGKEFYDLFKDRPIDKILTIEASGIGIASLTAVYFKVNHVVASKKFLSEGEHILIMDDFLANGCAVEGLIDIAHQAGAIVEGVGICIEKGFQGGGDRLRAQGYDVKSLAIIEEMDAESGSITFR